MKGEEPNDNEQVSKKPPRKTGGNGFMDKSLTGEYDLGKPPKKPGGAKLLLVLVLYSLLTQVKGEKLEDGEKERRGFWHMIFSMVAIIALVKIKNRMVVEYIKWMFDNKADDFLSRIKSRNYVECNRTKGAIWKDCRNYCKTKGGREGKTIYKFYGENFDDYFKKLDRETHVIARVKGCEWERAALLLLQRICKLNSVKTSSNTDKIRTATTISDESWEEGGSVISSLESGFDTVIVPLVGRQETNNERERIHTGNLLEAHKVSYERNRRNNHPEHQAHPEEPGKTSDVENRPRMGLCDINQEENVSSVEDPKPKKEAEETKPNKRAGETRRNYKIRPYHQRTKQKKSKRVEHMKTWIEYNGRRLKWWTMKELNKPFSCAANRYARFKSNRRFKPGD